MRFKPLQAVQGSERLKSTLNIGYLQLQFLIHEPPQTTTKPPSKSASPMIQIIFYPLIHANTAIPNLKQYITTHNILVLITYEEIEV